MIGLPKVPLACATSVVENVPRRFIVSAGANDPVCPIPCVVRYPHLPVAENSIGGRAILAGRVAGERLRDEHAGLRPRAVKFFVEYRGMNGIAGDGSHRANTHVVDDHILR